MPGTFPLANVRGIAIRIHPTAVFAFLLLIFLLAAVYFPALLPRERPPTHWSVAFISAFFLFLSTVAHELGHSLMARSRGVPVESITLVMFGGSSDIRRDSEKPLDETLIALSGPLVSLGIAAVAGVVRFTLPTQSQPLMLFLESVLLLNIWLGAFNLLPTLPLDGGRVVRGLVWYRTQNQQSATRAAATLGRIIAAALFATGVILLVLSLDTERGPITSLLGYDPRLLGVVAIVLAWFVNTGARNAYRQIELQGRFLGVTVGQLMTPDPTTVTPWTSLDEVVNQYFLQRGERAVAVVRDENMLMGLVAYADVRRIPRGEWPNRAAGQVMTPIGDLITVETDDNIEVAIRRMAERHYNQLPVVEDGRLVGMIARVNILRFIDLREARTAGRR